MDIDCCCKCIEFLLDQLAKLFYRPCCVSMENKCLKVLNCSDGINSLSNCFQAFWNFQSERLSCCLKYCPNFFLINLGYNGQRGVEDREKKKNDESEEEEIKKMSNGEHDKDYQAAIYDTQRHDQ